MIFWAHLFSGSYSSLCWLAIFFQSLPDSKSFPKAVLHEHIQLVEINISEELRRKIAYRESFRSKVSDNRGGVNDFIEEGSSSWRVVFL